MTINKAIELLQLELAAPGLVSIRDLNEAQRLGIEALKRIILGRNPKRPYVCDLLPGELLDWQNNPSEKED